MAQLPLCPPGGCSCRRPPFSSRGDRPRAISYERFGTAEEARDYAESELGLPLRGGVGLGANTGCAPIVLLTGVSAAGHGSGKWSRYAPARCSRPVGFAGLS